VRGRSSGIPAQTRAAIYGATAGEMQPVAGGRTDDLRQAQSTGEATLCAHTENRVTVPDGLSEMVGAPVGML
jgi:hypothetical protein